MGIKIEHIEIQQSNFALFFDYNSKIRRNMALLEERLSEWYQPPAVLPIPEHVNPEIPRLVFASLNNHSQLNFSYVTASLNTVYTDEFKDNYQHCNEYLKKRIFLLDDILPKVGVKEINYIGLTTVIKIPQSDMSITEVTESLINSLTGRSYQEGINEFSQRISFVHKDRMFINITISTYQDWNLPVDTIQNPNNEPLSDNKSVGRGIMINLDVNTRRLFNETGVPIAVTEEILFNESEELLKKTNDIVSTKIIDWFEKGAIVL